jgi:D-sedoheptulose 7-phosphate isomerase
MLDLRIQQHFIDIADLHFQVADGLAMPFGVTVTSMLFGEFG